LSFIPTSVRAPPDSATGGAQRSTSEWHQENQAD